MDRLIKFLTTAGMVTAVSLLVWLAIVWWLQPLPPKAIGFVLILSWAMTVVAYGIGRFVVRTIGFLFHLLRSNI